ncbi:energy transducer TonB [Sporomusa termitida]|uniref:TonB C-terminal domain-containing protein n=1 Tax=Sporomusa termitida TaxID=2377 RepID=A0A517DZB8_9FIRM|nr:energy transducer TonB [Sporomusa termitida]QDR82704.1 hypothetical protein SPTER_41340 [Sporomusa termitida]
MGKHPYVKATGISLLIHIVLLACLPIVIKPFTPVAAVAPIAVEFIPATVADTGDTLQQFSAAAAVPKEQREETKQVIREREKKQPPAKTLPDRQPPAQISETTGAGAVVSWPEGDGSEAVVGDNEGKQDDNHNQPVSRTQASLVSGSRPAYPRDAWKAGWEGVVVVRVLVGADGSVLSTSIRHGSGYVSLDTAAAQAVEKWRFSPARRGEAPVESFYDVKVRFRLADGK